MELEGDGPVPRPSAAPELVPTQNLQVSPENVVALAVMFRDCVDRLNAETVRLDIDLHLEHPWMEDPVSRWAREQFNKYFVEDEHSFAKIVRAEFERYCAVRDALVATAQHYGLTEELIAAGFTELDQ
jgi:hypothetical protein